MDLYTREQGAFRWDRFTVDPVRRALTCDGEPIKVAERVFDVLLYLVTHHGRIVDRHELMRAVWNDRIVEDSNIGQAIFELRKVLKANGCPGRTIVTVPGRGYRFAEPVQFESAPPMLPPQPAASQPEASQPVASQLMASRPGRPWPARTAAAAAMLAIVTGGLAVTYWPAHPPRPSMDKTQKPFAPPAHSIAVLAFDNLTGDPAQAYVSDGLSEQLIDSLTRIEAIEVAGRVSSFSFRGSHAPIADIARALNVGTILAGSVRRSGSRVIVTAELTNTITGFNIWSRTYDRDLTDIVAIQTDIARAVTQSLQIKLLGGEADKLTLGGTANGAAFDYYLRASRLERAAANEADHRAALADFDRALALDPGFARAHTGRANVLSNIAMLGAVGSAAAQHALMQAALTSADRAVALAPTLGQAHSVRAYILNFGLLDHNAAGREIAQAQMLTPGSAAIEGNYANIELAAGQVELAVTAARRGTQIDPLSVNCWGQLGRILFMARRYDEAAAALHHAATLTDKLPLRYAGLLGAVLLQQGQTEAARKLCADAASLETKEVLAIADDRLGHHAAAEADLAKLRTDQGDAGAFSYAEIYAQWGQKADALSWLQTAARLHDPGLAEIALDPMLDPIRGEAAFQQVQSNLGQTAAN